MVEVLKPRLADGRSQLFAVDSMDAQSWLNEGVPMPDRVRRHDQYEAYLIHEVFPFIAGRCGNGRITVTGGSFGAFPTVSFHLPHPALVHTAIALSGPLPPRVY